MFKSRKERECIKDIIKFVGMMILAVFTIPLLDGDATFCAMAWFVMILMIGGDLRYLYYLRIERHRRRMNAKGTLV